MRPRAGARYIAQLGKAVGAAISCATAHRRSDAVRQSRTLTSARSLHFVRCVQRNELHQAQSLHIARRRFNNVCRHDHRGA